MQKTLRKTVVHRIIIALVALLLCSCSTGDGQTNSSGLPAETPAPNISVLFINVGYGDAALIKIDDKSYMIDTGADSAAPALLNALSLMEVDELEAVFLTHTHKDHIGGLPALLQKVSVNTLYSAKISKNRKKGSNKIEDLAHQYSLNHIKLTEGEQVKLNSGIYFDCLGPLVYDEDDNDNSLILRMRANGRTLLFTGDMQFAEEKTLIENGTDLLADVLKVGNHGNTDATSKEFVRAVAPEIAIISTSTREDDDSANERVINALTPAQVLITQNYRLGVLLQIAGNGEISILDPS